MAKKDKTSDEVPLTSAKEESKAEVEHAPPALDSANEPRESASSQEPSDENPPLPDEELPTEPPLPDEPAPEDPRLPQEAPPSLPDESASDSPQAGEKLSDDGWEPVWDENHQAFYFYNRITQLTTWENPRVPTTDRQPTPPPAKKSYIGYNPAIHGDYDPTAPYAQQAQEEEQVVTMKPVVSQQKPKDGAQGDPYEATGHFNRFTGKWQDAEKQPENFNFHARAQRQMDAFFDPDAAVNSHDGRSLKAERAARKLTKKELKAFQEKRKEKKLERRRAWLEDVPRERRPRFP